METSSITYETPAVAKALGIPEERIRVRKKRGSFKPENPSAGRGHAHPYTRTDVFRLALQHELCELGITAEVAWAMVEDITFADIERTGFLSIAGRLRSRDPHVDSLLRAIPKGMPIFGEDPNRAWNGRIAGLSGSIDLDKNVSTAPVVLLPARTIWEEVEARLAEMSADG